MRTFYEENNMRTFCGALLLSLMACATESSAPTITVPPGDTDTETVYTLPGGTGTAALVFGEGTSFQFTGPTAPGSATFTAAPYNDLEEDDPQFGGGSVSITLGGQLYSASSLASLAATISDETGDYLAVSGFAQRVGPAGTIVIDAVAVVMPRSDFAPGATIVLDGQDRVALIASGNPEAERPDVLGAAVTGTVQLEAGSATVGGTITATVEGEFGPIEMLDTEEPPMLGDLTAGTYAVAPDAAQADVHCEGSLAGQEAAFASLTASSLGFVDGSVDVTTAPGLAISGAPISSGFGSASLAFDEVDVGMFVAFTDQTGNGPAGSALVGKYFFLDGTSATTTLVQGGLGAVYEATDGYCDVSFAATLTAP
ncbi:MAG: hypothetical protein SFX73_28170 [Kofleriaceae bacterium]|nr:hypothetical protein [Kofleriaceae bacterium]